MSESDTPALVIAAHGQRGWLETENGHRLPYLVKGKRLRIVCGDRVGWSRPDTGNVTVVFEIINRTNELNRSSPGRNRAETLAANLDCLLVAMAPSPEPDWYLIDRFLCAAELMGCTAGLVYNKTDLSPVPDDADTYRRLGYPIIATSAKQSAGLDALGDFLRDRTGVIVGQSGVGKSSLINVLIPEAAVTVGSLSASTDEGRHTTTAAIMHKLSNGGRLIDAPGVREFVPFIHDARELQAGFREIAAASVNCRFTDCHHLREPDCEVKAQLEKQRIDARRYESYKRLVASIRS